MLTLKTPPAPLFRDPIYDGAADPTIIWNIEEKSWWILYTNRRANVDCNKFTWVHGTDIGIASSSDGGENWVYRGILSGLEFERGRNTFWAPEVIFENGLYHMYVSYVRGVPATWIGERNIIHYTSKNLWDWNFESILQLSSKYVIDACVHKLPNGVWRMWYKDERNGAHTYAADSKDLYNWTVVGPVITDCPHEGPNVFCWKDKYWMIIDTWKGQGVYCSEDAENWVRRSDILSAPGTREDDGQNGLHGDVLVHQDQAYIFYFTHPDRNKAVNTKVTDVIPYEHRRTSLQVALLEFNGDEVICDRNKSFELNLKNNY